MCGVHVKRHFVPRWVDLRIKPAELRIENTLPIGQTFAWQPVGPTGDTAARVGQTHATLWVGVVGNAVMLLESTPRSTWMKVLNEQGSNEFNYQHYFRLEVALKPLYATWSKKCARFRKVGAKIPGVRILRQDIFETLISFVVSQNNNVARITKILQSIREKFGTQLEVDWSRTPELAAFRESRSAHGVGAASGSGHFQFYTFPTIEQILRQNPSEQDLRDIGLGYRARYIRQILDALGRLTHLGLGSVNKAEQSSSLVSTTSMKRRTASSSMHSAMKAKHSCDKSFAKSAKVAVVATKCVTRATIKTSIKQRAVTVTKATVVSTNVRAAPSKLPATLPSFPLHALPDLGDSARIVEELQLYMGIGHKVADCIALFACNCLELVPVDTHVRKIAVAYGVKTAGKDNNMNEKTYALVQEAFVRRFGEKAGWAHSVLFAAMLPTHKSLFQE